MKTKNLYHFYFISIILVYLIGCTNVQPISKENIEQIDEYFVTTMTIYDDLQQPFLRMVEINEKNIFIELIRQILDNPDYVYSYAQNDLYYVAQIYNEFSIAEFTVRIGLTLEPINSSGTQATYRNPVNNRITDIRTQLNKGKYDEFKNSLLDSGYYIHTKTFDNSQLVLLKIFSDVSHIITELKIEKIISYPSDRDAFWGIAKDILELDMNWFNDRYDFSGFLRSILFEEAGQIDNVLKMIYGNDLRVGEVVKFSYIYKRKTKGIHFLYKPHNDVFVDNFVGCYDYVRATEISSTWIYLGD